MSKWDISYKEGKTTQKGTYNKPGIYFIRDIYTKEIVYIGMSQSNCWKALYRHFQSWNDRVYRAVYQDRQNYEVRTIICSREQAYRWERVLINRIRPRDNNMYYDSDFEYEETENEYQIILESCPF